MSPSSAARLRSLIFGSVTRAEATYLKLNLVLTLLTAWASVTFFHPDEHYQVLEFMGYKLGFTTAATLPWEYAARIRPWLQPAAYYVLTSSLLRLGVADRFVLVLALRVASGLFACAALRAVWRVSRHWHGDDSARSRRLRFLTLAGFVPYLAVRTSSENLSASLFLFGFSCVMGGRPPETDIAAPPLPLGTALGGGALLGLAFETRYQTAFSSAGLVLWLSVVGKVRWRSIGAMGLGALLVVGIAAWIDRWGYGVWTFPAWSYLRVNLLEHAAVRFGSSPFYAYAYLPVANVFAPVLLPLLAALLACWLRRPRHVVTFCVVPFVLAHSVLAHKEERFLFPIAVLSLLSASLALEPSLPTTTGGFGAWLRASGARVACALRRFQATRGYRALLLWNFATMALLAVYPLGWRTHIPFYRWVEATLHAEGQARFVSDAPELVPDYPFYRRTRWRIERAGALARHAGSLASDVPAPASEPVYWVRRDPFELDAGALSGTLVYSEFPGWQSDWVRTHVFPWVARLRSIVALRDPKRAVWFSVYRLAPSSERAGSSWNRSGAVDGSRELD
jgi:phosphatidylinositol glycan class B